MTTISSQKRADTKALSPERVLQVALKLVKQDGIDFSMRDLAGHLNVWPMAIYRHYENRNALVEAIVEAVLHEALDDQALADLADETCSWQLRLERFALGLFDKLIEYPGVSKTITTYGALHTPSGLNLIQTVGDFLVSIGVSQERAAILFQSAAFFVAEMASLHYARARGVTDIEGFRSRAEAASEQFPNALNYIQHFAHDNLREHLRDSIQLLIIAAEAETKSD